MDIKFWGTRGSLPRATSHAAVLNTIEKCVDQAQTMGLKTFADFKQSLKAGKFDIPFSFGGNTSCTEVSLGSASLYVDSGSGIVHAGDSAMAAGRKEFHLFQTHFHWDHIMGLPFFVPIYVPGMKLVIYHVHKSGPDDMKIQFNGRNFPVMWEQLGAKVEFVQLKLYEKVKLGDLSISPFALDHPGGSFGYRIEANGRSFAVGVDGEYKRFTREELGKDLAYYQNLDVLVFDGQYEMEELASRYDWGHCTPTIGVDLALREGIKNLILTHHDPRSPDSKSKRMLEDAKKYLQTQIGAYKSEWEKLGQPAGPNLFSAFDGMNLTLSEKVTKIG